MRDIVKEYQEKFRRNHQRARRYTALLLALALTTSLFVNWQLHGVYLWFLLQNEITITAQQYVTPMLRH